MNKYAKLNDNNEIVEYVYFNIIPSHKQGKLLIVEYDAFPDYDSSLQYITEGVPNIEIDKVVIPWIINNKTPEQISQQNHKEWTPLQFWSRFTTEEQTAIFNESITNPALQYWFNLMGMATLIENDNPLTIQGMNNLVLLGFITAERKDAILN